MNVPRMTDMLFVSSRKYAISLLLPLLLCLFSGCGGKIVKETEVVGSLSRSVEKKIASDVFQHIVGVDEAGK